MKVLVVAPGPLTSTFDVFKGLCYGLEEVGVDVRPFSFHNRSAILHYGTMIMTQRFEVPEIPPKELLRYAATMMVGEALLGSLADWVLLVSGTVIDPMVIQTINNIKDRLGRPKIAVYLTEVPYMINEQRGLAKVADACFINDKFGLEEYQKINPNTFYCPHSYHPKIHFPVGVDEAHFSDVLFIGTPFEERIDFLSSIDWAGIDFRILGEWPFDKPIPKELRAYFEPRSVPNPEAAQFYNGAKIVLNVHRRSMARIDRVGSQLSLEGEIKPDTAYSVNPRVFEALACRSFLLTDYRPELEDIGKNNREFVVYKDSQDFQELISYYLHHDDERQRIAFNGWMAIKPFSFVERAEELKTVLEGLS